MAENVWKRKKHKAGTPVVVFFVGDSHAANDAQIAKLVHDFDVDDENEFPYAECRATIKLQNGKIISSSECRWIPLVEVR